MTELVLKEKSIKSVLEKMGFVPQENIYEEKNPDLLHSEFNKAYDVSITYKGDAYYGSSYVDMPSAYRDLLDDVPDELLGTITKKLGE